jgi:putative nucleotidyltransferase with HDIG domain
VIEDAHNEQERMLCELVARGELDIPVLPEAAAEVLALVQSPRCDAAALTAVIRRDPSLSASFVRIASSPAYAGAIKLTSVQQAVARLGFTTIVQLTLAAASRARVFAVPGFEDELREAFRHALMTALFAQEIARFRRSPVDAAFTAGLLHDFGKPVLLQTIARLPGARLGNDADDGALLAAADRLHTYVGGDLAVRWGFVDAIGDAVRTHHAPACELAHIIAVADAFAHGEACAGASAAALNLYPEDLVVIARKAGDIAATAESIT